MGRAFSSIQGRLVSLLLLVLVPILVAQAYFSYDRYQSSRRVASEANLELARSTAKAFDTFVQDVLHQELAIGLAFTSSQTLSEKEKNRILFDNQAGNPAIWHFFWDNPAGKVIAATGSQFIGLDISDREFYREIVAGKDWVVSDLLLSKTTGQPSFTISRGIRNERGELLGIIVAGILPAKLDRVLAVERLGDAGVSLLDSKGMHVYRYPATQYTWEQRNWLKLYPFLEQVAKGKEVVNIGHVSKIRAGTSRIVAFSPVPSIGWIASCSRAEKETVGPIISATLQETGLTLLVALVSLLTAFALSRTISSSVIILRNHALSLGRGETENPLTISRPTEIKELAEAFNKMAEEMRFREKALRESEERLSLAVEGAAMATWDVDTRSGRTVWSHTHFELFGYPPNENGEATMEMWRSRVHPDDLERVTRALETASATGSVYAPEHRIFRADNGKVRWLSVFGRFLKNDEGEAVRFVGIFFDITERKRAEEELHKSRQNLANELDSAQHLQRLSNEMIQADRLEVLYERILDTAVAILHSDFASIQILDPEGGKLRLLGHRGFSAEAAKFWEKVKPDSRSSCNAALCRGERYAVSDVLEDDFVSGSADMEMYLKTGIRAVQTTPLLSRSGKLLGMISTHWRETHQLNESEIRTLDLLARQAADLIDSKRSEEELRRAREDLEIRVRERTAELERKNRELQDFAFIASHDLSEPLRKIQTFGELLKAKSENRLSEQERDYVSRMTGAASRMQELLDALLRYSRIETKGSDHVPVKLDDIVRTVTSDLEVSLRKTGVNVEIGSLPSINGDPYQWRQVFQNLIANAVKYHRSEVKPGIRISCEQNGDGCLILVEDNGIGFDEKYLDKIFQPFQRLHGRNEYPGTGIGLAICRKVVERHGGTITAKSTPGKGSTFIVTLPVNGEIR